MVVVNNDTISESSDDSYFSDSDSDTDSILYYGYSDRPRRRARGYISMDTLKSEYNVNMEMNKKILLFFQAVVDEDIEFMRTLMSDGIQVDCTGRDGWTALMKACLDGKPDVVEFLLQQGANINYQSDYFTPLMACCTRSYATEAKKHACLEHLLNYNVEINVFDKYRATALMYAAGAGYTTIVNTLLLQERTNVHALDSEGWNAVFYAVSNNRSNVVKMLIEFGLDYKLQDGFGRTPKVLAVERCYRKLADMITLMDENESTLNEMSELDEDKDEYGDKERIMFSNYLKELPNEDGEGGFELDTKEVLKAFGFKFEGNISFPDFLNMNVEDLAKAGFKIQIRRRTIMKKIIHRFHIWPWNKSSMHTIPSNTELRMGDLLAMIGSITKHLTLMKSSLRYLSSRIDARQDEGDLTVQRDFVNALVSTYTSNKQTQERFERMLELIKKMKPDVSDDIIVNPKKKLKSTGFGFPFLYGLISLGAAVAGYLLFNSRLKMNR